MRYPTLRKRAFAATAMLLAGLWLPAASHAIEVPPEETVFQAPLEGGTDAKGPAGGIQGSAEELEFIPGVVGRGALLTRYGYDRRSSLRFGNVEGIIPLTFTASCFFIPNWNGEDGAVHGLLAATAGDCQWRLFKNPEGELVFNVVQAERSLSVKTDISGWHKGVPKHLAAICDGTNGGLSLIVDGSQVAKVPRATWWKGSGKAASLIVGDMPEADLYSLTQAEGVVDEIRIFARALSPGECAKEMQRKTIASEEGSQEGGLPQMQPNAKEERLWDLAGTFEQRTATRRMICLNSLWRCQLVNADKGPQPEEWKYLPVPGRYSGQEGNITEGCFQFRDSNLTKIPLGSGGRTLWNGQSTHDFKRAWFERAFKAESSWLDKNAAAFSSANMNCSQGSASILPQQPFSTRCSPTAPQRSQ